MTGHKTGGARGGRGEAGRGAGRAERMTTVGVLTILFLFLCSGTASGGADMSACRSVVAGSVRSCLRNANCDESDHRGCVRTCKHLCSWKSQCDMTRELWSTSRSDYCCACEGVRC